VRREAELILGNRPKCQRHFFLHFLSFDSGKRMMNGRPLVVKRVSGSEDGIMGVWQGVAMDSLGFHPGPSFPTLLRPADGLPPKRPYSCFRGSLPTGWAAYGRLLPPGHPPLYASGTDSRRKKRIFALQNTDSFFVALARLQWEKMKIKQFFLT
jgi:hypothetical protein